ncbi:hypothetical protein [Faucicola atlantae]|uniref:hypothetical protein n=1 Tax=Faucicola atlantae TaxID=34059 RepID=UPI0025B01F9C|nr:hypothetical protein [Moraxella atlantae]
MLSLLHTSDWHLGRRLHGMARYAEFEQFLAWQLAVLRAQAHRCAADCRRYF